MKRGKSGGKIPSLFHFIGLIQIHRKFPLGRPAFFVTVEKTFEHEWLKYQAEAANKQAPTLKQVTFHQKALVATGVIALSSLLGGCGSSDDVSATAYEECKWEAASGNNYNCDDDNDSFYSSRGYHGKKTIIPSTSKYAQYKASSMSTSSSKGGIGSAFSGIFGG